MSVKTRIKLYRLGARILATLVLGLIALNVTVSLAYATKYYPGGLSRCISDSGHSNIYSVTNFACPKAVQKAQNACASWLGSATDSRSSTIVASSMTGTVSAKLWGMCTDRANKSATMDILPPNAPLDIFSCGGSCNFTRSGNWGSPSSNDVQIDVAKFIQYATPTTLNGQLAYYMHVIIDRQHGSGSGGNGSYGLDFSDIWLVISNVPPIPEPVIPDPCMAAPWNPAAYNDSVAKSSDTYVDIKIQNFEDRFKALQFGKWNDNKIYAMPTDKVAWQTCYYAGTPVSAHEKVSNVNNGTKYKGHNIYPSELSTTECQSADTRKNNRVELWTINPWENKLYLSGDAQVIWTGDEIVGGVYDVFTKMYVSKHNGRQTVLTDAGLTFTEKAQTGRPTSVSIACQTPKAEVWKNVSCSCGTNPDGTACTTTCSKLICTNQYTPDTEWCQATVNYNDKKDEVSVDIPYNFDNYPGVAVSAAGSTEDDPESNLAVYSGETAVSIDDFWVTVAPRYNAVTVASYATEVPSSQVKLYAYVADNTDGEETDSGSGDGCGLMKSWRGAKQCKEFWGASFGETNGLNSGGLLEGKMETKDSLFGGAGLNDWYRAFDAAAGDYMCFVAAVWPATSGSDTQMGTSGDNMWRYSEPACLVVAKRPTFQVWGDMYSNPGVSADVGKKYNLYTSYRNNNSAFDQTKNSGQTYFGSWVENGLILNGATTTLASGAATARNSATATKSGSKANSICKRSPLTIANRGCTNSTGHANIPAGMSNLDETVDYWLGISSSNITVSGDANNVTLGSGTGWNDVASATGKTVKYLNASGNVTINASNVSKDTTYLVKAGGKVTINGNIKYSDAGYTTLGQVPKVVIYGGGGIDAKCNVSDIHAILVTPGKFETCSDYKSLSIPTGLSDDEMEEWEEKYPYYYDPELEKVRATDRLKIFGAVVSNTVSLRRIFGAAAWDPGKYPENTYSKFARDGVATSDGLAAEIFDYDSSVMMWGEFMSSSAESDTLQIMYQSEQAPRY